MSSKLYSFLVFSKFVSMTFLESCCSCCKFYTRWSSCNAVRQGVCIGVCFASVLWGYPSESGKMELQRVDCAEVGWVARCSAGYGMGL